MLESGSIAGCWVGGFGLFANIAAASAGELVTFPGLWPIFWRPVQTMLNVETELRGVVFRLAMIAVILGVLLLRWRTEFFALLGMIIPL